MLTNKQEVASLLESLLLIPFEKENVSYWVLLKGCYSLTVKAPLWSHEFRHSNPSW